MNITSAHLAAILAFSLWGLLPIYWKVFEDVSAWDLFGHRLMWSFITLVFIMAARKKLKLVKEILQSPQVSWMLVMSALLISSNWLLYIYAISNERVLEASMGYFLNPIINVFMGWLILKEKIRKTQWPPIILAMLAMLLLAMQTDLQHFPWIAVILSVTFALYSLIRKMAKVGSMEGLTFETSVLIIPIMIYWHFQETDVTTAAHILPAWKILLLAFSGVMTSTPLILFAYAAKRLPLQTLGFTQYLSPSFKFICGLVVFNEALSYERLQTFALIWVALIYYTTESYFHTRKRVVKTAAPPTTG